MSGPIPSDFISFHFIPFHSIPFRSRPFDSIVPEEYIRHYVRAFTSVPVKAFPQEFRSPKNFVYQSYAVCHMIARLIYIPRTCFTCITVGKCYCERIRSDLFEENQSQFGKFILSSFFPSNCQIN